MKSRRKGDLEKVQIAAGLGEGDDHHIEMDRAKIEDGELDARIELVGRRRGEIKVSIVRTDPFTLAH